MSSPAIPGSSPSSPVSSIHFVGSIPLPSASATLHRLATATPAALLRRLPDGEPGERQNFVVFQRAVFADCAFVLRPADFSPNNPRPAPAPVPVPVPGPAPATLLPLRPTAYDEHALSSYRTFCALRARGVIPPHGVRFQASLPSPANVVGALVEAAWRPLVEPRYAAALRAAVRRIQDAVPARDLALQWDLAVEFAMLEEDASGRRLQQQHERMQWFDGPLMDGLMRRICPLAEAVDDGVELGFHLCYGDLGHRHFVEPADLGLLVEVARRLVAGVGRRVDWIHMPVPKARTDAAYFRPLEGLELGPTELVLGLVHMDDEEGTRKRMEVARRVVPRFGIATECGLGRASEAELDSVLEIARKVAEVGAPG